MLDGQISPEIGAKEEMVGDLALEPELNFKFW